MRVAAAYGFAAGLARFFAVQCSFFAGKASAATPKEWNVTCGM
jgi:hypothetical protein